MVQNISQNREMIFLEGVGGLTDDVIAAKTGAENSDTRIEKMLKKGRITVVPAVESAVELVKIFRSKLLPAD
jgi:hypothetical protein